MNAVELGKQIRARRKSLGITIQQLSNMTGLSTPTIGALERAEKASNNSTVIRVLKVLDLPTEAEKPEKAVKSIDSAIEQHIEQIMSLPTIEGVTISIAGTDNCIAYAKTYRK